MEIPGPPQRSDLPGTTEPGSRGTAGPRRLGEELFFAGTRWGDHGWDLPFMALSEIV